MKTIKSKFNYLEERPIRYFKTAKFAIGCPAEEEGDKVVVVELKDPSDYPDDDAAREFVAYIVEGGQPLIETKKTVTFTENVNKKGEDGKWAEEKVQVTFPSSLKKAPIFEFKRLYFDDEEMFFAVVFFNEAELLIGRVQFKQVKLGGAKVDWLDLKVAEPKRIVANAYRPTQVEDEP